MLDKDSLEALSKVQKFMQERNKEIQKAFESLQKINMEAVGFAKQLNSSLIWAQEKAEGLTKLQSFPSTKALEEMRRIQKELFSVNSQFNFSIREPSDILPKLIATPVSQDAKLKKLVKEAIKELQEETEEEIREKVAEAKQQRKIKGFSQEK